MMYRGWGARLLRAMVQLSLDRNADAYEEIRPPTLVRTDTMIATGHLPKFEDEAYHIERDDLWAIPTAEVPLTSLHRDEVLDEADLPLRYTAHTSCFRREAGAAGRDTRGLLRVHEFDKVELLAVAADADAGHRLPGGRARPQRVDAPRPRAGLPRPRPLRRRPRRARPPAPGTSRPTRPGCDLWLEVSSVSWFADYQARRAEHPLPRRRAARAPRSCHTVNGSAMGWPRTVAAYLETHRQPDGVDRRRRRAAAVPRRCRGHRRPVDLAVTPGSLGRARAWRTSGGPGRHAEVLGLAGRQPRQARRHRRRRRPRGHRRARARHHEARVRHRPGQLPEQGRPGLQGQRRLPGALRRPGDGHAGHDGRGQRVAELFTPENVAKWEARSRRSCAGTEGVVFGVVTPAHGDAVHAEPRHARDGDAAEGVAGQVLLGATERDPQPGGQAARLGDVARDARAPHRHPRGPSATSATPTGYDFLLHDNQGEIRKSLRPFFPDEQHAQMVIRLPGNPDIEAEGARPRRPRRAATADLGSTAPRSSPPGAGAAQATSTTTSPAGCSRSAPSPSD